MKIIVRGIVQGVGFRPTVARIARRLGIKGYVLNKGSYVEIFVEERHEEFLRELMKNLPPLARIEKVELIDEPPDEDYNGFEIKKSRDDIRTSIIPPDTAICKECLLELFDPHNRRYLYPFTNCTNCGARFSLIEDIPYDRERTSMKEFKMCERCLTEYLDPGSRRYDAQTISCPACGPKFYFIEEGKRRYVQDPIKEFAEGIDSGKIGAIKGWGGFHIVCKLSEIPRLRKIIRRPQKPFAVMFRSIEAIEEKLYVNELERELLLSPARPIVLLKKKSRDPPLEYASPGLPNVGAYLPYSGLHYVLFHYLSSDEIVMTSGNYPGEPMAISDEEIRKIPVDMYLGHERRIVNRIDDSVAKVYKDKIFLIRRSRGYVPLPFEVDYEEVVLSLGAEMNITFSISKGGKLYPSQHIGDGGNLQVLQFMLEMISKFKKWLGISEIEKVGVDMHPGYSTRALAEREFEEFVEIQHHHAHAASLLFDSGISEAIVLTLDGTGYGEDGKIWGGEVLVATYSDYERIGSLAEVEMPGGEKAIWEPKLMYLAYLSKAKGERQALPKGPKTTSMGRFLDALSYALGVCEKATYDGEPAMKLETLLELGKNDRKFEVEIRREGGRKVVDPSEYFLEIPSTLKERAKFAYSLVWGVISSLVEIAVEEGERRGIEHIGISGGVSYDLPICEMFEREVREREKIPIFHNKVPNGDAGISIGQNVIIGKGGKRGMCLGIPAKVLEVKGDRAIVDFGGVRREISVAFVKAKPGDYVIVHAGFAIEKLKKHEAEEILKELREIAKVFTP